MDPRQLVQLDRQDARPPQQTLDLDLPVVEIFLRKTDLASSCTVHVWFLRGKIYLREGFLREFGTPI